MTKSTSKDYQLNVNLFTALLDGTFEKIVEPDNYYTCPICQLVCHIDDTEACTCFHTEKDIEDQDDR
tara:strand:- start:55 stop:255 length:201 start_codon:yes stop_codon:yes gene_type:complete